MAISTPTTRGTPRTVPKWKSIPSTTPPNARCSAPSGWTALSDMIPGQGLLHVVPIPEAMAYVLLRPCSTMCRKMSCAALRRAECCRSLSSGTRS